MSFRINTNVAAMNTLRNIGNTNMEFNHSITRLSTGLRINSAADDPAGLIISESFRAQLTGIDQAMRNSQDAINYAKTAEGALDEVNRLLRDARGLAVAAGNTGALTASQIQANQSQIASIVSSVTRIASTTQFGTKKLLDGSSGVSASVTDGSKVSSIMLSGQFGGAAVTANGAVTVTVTQAATQAAVNSKAIATAATAVGAGSFSLNGVTFTTDATTTAAQLVDKVNQASGQTGVTARYDTANTRITFESVAWGSGGTINVADANGVVLAAAGSTSATGTNALATVGVGSTTALFTGSLNGNGGLTLSDADGNTVSLTQAGNAISVTNATVGQVLVGSSQFQIGANAGQTTNLSLGNFAASQLGGGVVSGVTLANLDLTSSSGATNALKVIDAAIDQVTKARGSIGNFQRNVMESNIRSLGVARENLAATESTIRDTDVAAEMTNFTKQQILQQAGMSVLSQANAAPQSVLSLLR
jgi:flagellin